jgi:hypothetical protein
MHPQATRAKLAGMITLLTVGVACAGANRIAAAGPDTRPGAAVAETQPALDPTVDKILTRLETRAVNDLQAKVSWTLRYVLDEDADAVTKKGELWYRQQQPAAKFLVHFTQKVTANRIHELDERHLFDGRWYVELNSETKTVKLGEGPFPVPFGQKKADILKEFDVSFVPRVQTDPPATDHLKLIARPSSESGHSYRQVDVWVAQEGPEHGLPIQVLAAKKDPAGKVNSFITIKFEEVRLNQGLGVGVFEIRTPAGYDEPPPERLEPIELPEGAAASQPAQKPTTP